MPNPQDIFQLAQQTATQVTASPENWRRFLYTAAHNYHTTYLNQLLIHAQRPDATACATMKYWNEQAHRKVMYGSKSIIILQRHQGVPTAKRVFSMTDTVLTGDKAAAPWEVTDAIRPLLMQVNSVGSLMDRATEQVVSLSDRANRVLATSIEDSALNWSHPEDQRFILQELAAQSTLYMICIRLGIPVQEEDFPAFQNVTQFDTSRISLCLGGYVQAAAEPLLDELGHEVMQLARDSVAIQAEPVHNTDTQSPTQTTSREEAVTDDVHEREGLSDSEPELAESQENQPEPVRQDAAGLLGAERAEPVRPDDAGGNAAVELPQDGAGCAADGGQDAARSDAESADARPQDEPSGLGTDVQQPEAAGGGNDPSDAVRSITEEPAAAESEPSPSAFSLPEFPAELLPFLLKADTTSRASNADILSFFSKTPLLIDRLRYIRESYKVVFTELLLDDDTRVGFYKESNGLLLWQGSYLTRSAESHLSWHSVTAAISALVDNHELIAAIDPKKAVSQDEQLSFDLPENASRGDEVGALEVDDIYSEEEQDEKIKAALPTYHYKEPQPDDGSHITEDDVNVIITRGSVFEGGKYRIYNHFQQKKTEKETVVFLKKEYGIGGFSWTFTDGGSGFVNFDGKGFSILYDFKDDLRYEKKLKWKEVGKRLECLVRMDRYLTDAEREKMPAWINRQAESKPLPPPIPDQKPVCEVGSTVYLENDQRFTVESIGQFDVHLRNEDFPLVGRAVSREQFQQLLDANPHNGGMVLSEQQRESLVQEQREQALSYIEDYLKDEFEITEPDFSDLTQIDLGYTTTEDEQHTIKVHADLEHCTISKFVDDTLYAQDTYASLEDMNRMALANLDFDSLMEVDINEIEEQEPEISADEPEKSTFVSQVMQDVDRLAAREEPAEYDRTNYLAPYEPAVPEGPKAKFAANVQAIRTLKEIEQRMASGGAPASEQEQDILAGYLGWGGLADAFDPGKDNWHTEYEQLKALLTEDEYAAARESTLTAFYTPPAVIHLDCPWRPADIAQRNGRMVRQGNLNKEVSIFIYVTESTFDSYSWQLVENKQKFISQIMTSKSPARSCEDLDEAALTYAEVKALAAGNPMIKEKMDLDIQVARLRTLKAAYTSQHYRLEDAVAVTFPRQIKGTEHRIRAFEQDIQTAKEHQSYDADKKLIFSIELDGKTYDKREDAGKALLGLVGAAVRATKPVPVGHYAGFEITVEYKPLEKVFHAHLVGEATHTTKLGNDAAGNMIRFQNVVSALPQDLNRLHGSLEQLTKQLTNAEEELKQPFFQEQELSDKSARLAELDALLNVGNDAPIIEGEAEELEEEPEDALIQSDDELER